MILEYFDESTSSLTNQIDCCDNCEKGVSTWQLNDLYHGFNSSGHYNFEIDARILLRAIEEMEKKNIKPEREAIVRHLQGVQTIRNQSLITYGTGQQQRQPYYWNALIDQLNTNDYIKFAAGKTQLTLCVQGKEWLDSYDDLWQKPVGATFRFLRLKRDTPISDIRWSRNYKNYSSEED